MDGYMQFINTQDPKDKTYFAIAFQVFEAHHVTTRAKVITNTLNTPIAKARFVRISPQSWNHEFVSLRFDVLGCELKGKNELKFKLYRKK